MSKIKGLDNEYHTWNISHHKTIERNNSELHIRARNLLKEIFPLDTIHEEISLPGTQTIKRKKLLIADFYIHSERLMIEVHGAQHYKHVKHFHKSRSDYNQAVRNDNDKLSWCEINNIQLIILPYMESDNEWRYRILNR